MFRNARIFGEKGWAVLFDAINQINDENLNIEITIRGEKHSVLDALLRQLAHYPYHIGQIVYIAEILKSGKWQTLSIPRNKSAEFNLEMSKKAVKKAAFESASPVCFVQSDEVREDFRLP